MADRSRIEWTEATWNPVRGCSKVSPGCRNCYAERFAERWRGVDGHPFAQGFDVRLVPEALELPLRWRRARRIFVNSMSDLFHEAVPDSFILQVLDVIRRCRDERPGHVFQVLTKRSARMEDFCGRLRWDGAEGGRLRLAELGAGEGVAAPGERLDLAKALPNLWLGVSVEDQRAAEERIASLLQTRAATMYLSCEPLLGPVDLRQWVVDEVPVMDDHLDAPDGAEVDGLERVGLTWRRRSRLAWVIVGGESGPGARTCDLAWVRSIVRQASEAGIAVFVKQLGARPFADHPGTTHVGTEHLYDPGCRVRLRDRKGADPEEWPADLRVRQVPEVEHG